MAKRLGTLVQTKLINKLKKLKGKFWQIYEDVYKREYRPGKIAVYSIFRTGTAAPYWERSKLGKVYTKVMVDKAATVPLKTIKVLKRPSSARKARPSSKTDRP